MPLSEKLKKLIAFARKKAKDPEFLAQTAHRRAPAAPPPDRQKSEMLAPEEIARLRRLKKTIAELPLDELDK